VRVGMELDGMGLAGVVCALCLFGNWRMCSKNNVFTVLLVMFPGIVTVIVVYCTASKQGSYSLR